jgi:uncharacterized protein
MEFRVSIFQQFIAGSTPATGVNGFVEDFVSFALESKAFCVFSFLFGVGLAMQLERLSRRPAPYLLLTRRLVALLGFGLIHLIFIWNGDILTEYALAGLLILPFLRLPNWALAVAAAGFFTLYALMPSLPPLVAWPDTSAFASDVATADRVYSAGFYLEGWRFSVHELPLLVPLHVFVFPRTVALFLFGAFVWRMGVLRQPSSHSRLFSVVAAAGLGVGMALTYGATAGAFNSWGTLGMVLQALAPVVLAVGYGSVVIYLAQLHGAHNVLRPFAAVGRMAFTNYIAQSLIFGFVFFGYGLGLFGKMNAAPALLFGVIVYLLQAVLSAAWLRRFRFGPLEWFWRSLMYGRAQPMLMAVYARSAAEAYFRAGQPFERPLCASNLLR